MGTDGTRRSETQMMPTGWKDMLARHHVGVAQRRPRRGGTQIGSLIAVASVVTFGVTACSDSRTPDSGEVASASGATLAPNTDATGAPTTAARLGFTVHDSPWSFDATLSVFRKNVANAGMVILGNINQGAALKSTGLTLLGSPTALWGAHAFFIGDPTRSQMLIQRDPAVGAVIPLQMYVWTDDSGKVHLGYFDPAALFSAVDPKFGAIGREMAVATAKIAEKTAGSPRTYGETVPARFVAYNSLHSFDATVDAFRESVARADMTILADLDPHGAGKRTQSEAAQTFFVGNVAESKLFFDHDAAVGALIPMRMYVWTDDTGNVRLGYFDPSTLFSAVDPKLADAGERTGKVADQIARGAVDDRG